MLIILPQNISVTKLFNNQNWGILAKNVLFVTVSYSTVCYYQFFYSCISILVFASNVQYCWSSICIAFDLIDLLFPGVHSNQCMHNPIPTKTESIIYCAELSWNCVCERVCVGVGVYAAVNWFKTRPLSLNVIYDRPYTPSATHTHSLTQTHTHLKSWIRWKNKLMHVFNDSYVITKV